MIETILAHIAAAEFECYGIRVQRADQAAVVGETLPKSFRWDDGEITDDRLAGTSTIGLQSVYGQAVTAQKVAKAVALIEGYRWDGGAVLLVGGMCCEHGEDQGELIIDDATVIEVLA